MRSADKSAVLEFRSVIAAGSLLLAAAVAPVWNRSPDPLPEQLYLGRFALLVLAIAALAYVRELPTLVRPRFRDPRFVALGSLAVLTGWVVLRAVGASCLGCEGSAAGLVEFTIIGVLVAYLCSVDPTVRRLAIPATLITVAIAIVAASEGIVSFWRPTEELRDGRLAGLYENPNFLGLIVALGPPVLIAFGRRGRRWRQIGVAVGAVLTCAVLLMTFSRSAILSAYAGSVVVLFMQARSSRSVFRTSIGALVTLVGLLVAYPSFQTWREDVSFRSFRTASLAQDASGWNVGKSGAVRRGPSAISTVATDSGPVIRVVTDQPDEGITYPWTGLINGGMYELVARLRTVGVTGGVTVATGDERAIPATIVGSALTTIRIPFLGAGTSSGRDYTSFVLANGPGTFEVVSLKLDAVASAAGPRRSILVAPTKLLGRPAEQALRETYSRVESEYTASRATALRLASDAARQRPLVGIGWERFPPFADARSKYGPLATHNEYARIAAEVGLPALLLLLVGGVAAGIALKQRSPSVHRTAAWGVAIAWVVELAFANVLVVPSSSVPAALILGWICRPDRTAAQTPHAGTA